MTKLRTSLCWASAFILLAVANRLGWVADKDATTMLAILPALWVVSGALGHGCGRKAAA